MNVEHNNIESFRDPAGKNSAGFVMDIRCVAERLPVSGGRNLALQAGRLEAALAAGVNAGLIEELRTYLELAGRSASEEQVVAVEVSARSAA